MSGMPLTWSEVDDQQIYEHDSYTVMQEHLYSSGMIEFTPKPISDDQVFLNKFNEHLDATTREAQEDAAVSKVMTAKLQTGELRSAKSTIQENDDEEDSDDLFGDDDDTINEMMRKRLEAFSYRATSTAETSKRGITAFGGGMLEEIQPDEFEDKVKVASKNGSVVMVLYKEKSSACDLMLQLLSRLAAKFNYIKFAKMRGDTRVSNFPSEHCPTIMCYKNGEVVCQFVRLEAFHGSLTTADDIEWSLSQVGILESEFTEDPREAALFE